MVKFACNLFVKALFYINNSKYMILLYLRRILLVLSACSWLLMN